MGVHCVAHKENLTIESMGDYIEAFMMNMYSYFSHSLNNTWSLEIGLDLGNEGGFFFKM